LNFDFSFHFTQFHLSLPRNCRHYPTAAPDNELNRLGGRYFPTTINFPVEQRPQTYSKQRTSNHTIKQPSSPRRRPRTTLKCSGTITGGNLWIRHHKSIPTRGQGQHHPTSSPHKSNRPHRCIFNSRLWGTTDALPPSTPSAPSRPTLHPLPSVPHRPARSAEAPRHDPVAARLPATSRSSGNKRPPCGVIEHSMKTHAC
jgi:hypothetical protein